LYFSHSSSEYEINRIMMTALPNPSGRLIHFSRATDDMKVLLDKLWFGNGVAISPDEDFVVVAESFASRLMRVWLTGPRKGSAEVFFDGLPGAPDNLSFDIDGIWVPLASAADDKHPMLNHLLAPYPLARKFLVRLLELIKMPFEFVNSIYPNRVANFVAREFGSMDMILFILPPRRTIIRLNWKGNVVKSYHGSDKSTGTVTHAMKLGNYLYLGSVTSDFIGRVEI
jgi:adipocyte plasma membrane-associated protein